MGYGGDVGERHNVRCAVFLHFWTKNGPNPSRPLTKSLLAYCRPDILHRKAARQKSGGFFFWQRVTMRKEFKEGCQSLLFRWEWWQYLNFLMKR
jgi:hypothetical protein